MSAYFGNTYLTQIDDLGSQEEKVVNISNQA